MITNYTPDQQQNEIPYGYCHCGCGQKTKTCPQNRPHKGLKKGDPYRFIKGHAPHNEPERNFWKYVDKSGGDNACWLWKSTCFSDGYGQFNSIGKTYHAHRIAWQLKNGEIPDNLCVLHNCPSGDNPRCCNPNHLWLGTKTQNNADRNKKNRQTQGESHYSAKLSEDDVKEIIRVHHSEKLSHRKLAKRFGVSKSSITRILSGRGWKCVHRHD